MEHQEEISRGFYFKHVFPKRPASAAKNTASDLFSFLCAHDPLGDAPQRPTAFLAHPKQPGTEQGVLKRGLVIPSRTGERRRRQGCHSPRRTARTRGAGGHAMSEPGPATGRPAGRSWRGRVGPPRPFWDSMGTTASARGPRWPSLPKGGVVEIHTCRVKKRLSYPAPDPTRASPGSPLSMPQARGRGAGRPVK